MILTEVGEIGIYSGGEVFVLRPSLYAMSQLGEPEEILELFSRVMGESPTLGDAVNVLWCCTDADISEITGYIGESEEVDGKPISKWIEGEMNAVDAVHLARCLLKHGIVGVTDEKPKQNDGKYIKEFKAQEYVSLAIAHLGFTEREAWNLTMTGLVNALKAKFPSADNSAGSSAPSLEEHEKTMEWFERVEAARAKKTGKH